MEKFLLFASSVILAVAALMLANDALNRHLIFSASNSNPYKMRRLFDNPEKGESPSSDHHVRRQGSRQGKFRARLSTMGFRGVLLARQFST